MCTDARAGEEIWRRLLDRVRGGDAPAFDEHWSAFLEASARRLSADDPLPVWHPGLDAIECSNVGSLMRDRGLADYEALHRWSVDERAAFWEEAVRRVGVVWAREPDVMLDASRGSEHPVWARGGRLNIVESCPLVCGY